MAIRDAEVIKKVFRTDRWYVSLTEKYRNMRTIPMAIYVWLKGNPAFDEVPKNYVIHHLDNDPLNDDISNLVIFQKNHHIAHHFKYRDVETKVEIDKRSLFNDYFEPTRRPPVGYIKSMDRWIPRVPERNQNGIIKCRFVYNYEGKKIRTEEHANQVADDIWKRFKDYEKYTV